MSEDVVSGDQLTGLAAAVQEAMDTVAEARGGQASDDIFVALKAELAKRAVTQAIPNEALHAYADAIAEGREVRVDPNDLGAQA